MDNFDLKKYLAEGRLLNEQTEDDSYYHRMKLNVKFPRS